MAEIKIEKKKPVWPWVLLLLGLIALVYFLFFRDKEAEQDVVDEVEETTSMLEDEPANSNNTRIFIVSIQIC